MCVHFKIENLWLLVHDSRRGQADTKPHPLMGPKLMGRYQRRFDRIIRVMIINIPFNTWAMYTYIVFCQGFGSNSVCSLNYLWFHHRQNLACEPLYTWPCDRGHGSRLRFWSKYDDTCFESDKSRSPYTTWQDDCDPYDPVEPLGRYTPSQCHVTTAGSLARLGSKMGMLDKLYGTDPVEELCACYRKSAPAAVLHAVPPYPVRV